MDECGVPERWLKPINGSTAEENMWFMPLVFRFPFPQSLRLRQSRDRSGGAIIWSLAPPCPCYVDDALQSIRAGLGHWDRSEEHTSELQSLMRNSYAVFCLKKQNKKQSPI